MSIKYFHIGFISISLVLLLGCSAWCFNAWRTAGEAKYAVIGVLSAVFGVALAVYGMKFIKKMRRWA